MRKKIIFLTAVLLMLLNTAALGATKAEFKIKTPEHGGQVYTLTLYKMDSQCTPDDIICIDEEKSTSESNVKFDIVLDVKSGYYPYKVTSETGWETTGKYFFINEKEYDIASVQLINESTSWQELKSRVLEWNSKASLGFDESLSESNRNLVFQALARKLPFSDIAALRSAISQEMSNLNGDSTPTADKITGSRGGGGVSFKQDYAAPAIVPPAAESAVFEDIDDVQWAHDAIYSLKEKGAISGRTNTLFEPNSNITREEFIKILTVAFEVKQETENAFDDVDANSWYAPYVNGAHKYGIVTGMGDNIFGVGLKITREDAVVMGYRMLFKWGRNMTLGSVYRFSDSADISDYAKDAVSCFEKAGIINGSPDGNFYPQNYITRAEAAKLIYEMGNK